MHAPGERRTRQNQTQRRNMFSIIQYPVRNITTGKTLYQYSYTLRSTTRYNCTTQELLTIFIHGINSSAIIRKGYASAREKYPTDIAGWNLDGVCFREGKRPHRYREMVPFHAGDQVGECHRLRACLTSFDPFNGLKWNEIIRDRSFHSILRPAVCVRSKFRATPEQTEQKEIRRGTRVKWTLGQGWRHGGSECFWHRR